MSADDFFDEHDELDDLPPVAPFSYAPWMDDALCAQTDPELFFPHKGGPVRVARAVCARCPVQAECLNHALAGHERYGIFGGVTPMERRKLLRLSKGESA